MLIKFSLRNYKTFREPAEWTMVASPDDTYESDNVIETGKDSLRLLRSAVVYGANASGKSKFIDGIRFMDDFVSSSSKESLQNELIPVQPFRLATQTENEPTEFEIQFLHEGVRYRYGFEVLPTHIVAEWLYYRPNTKEVPLFYRDEQNFDDTHASFKRGIVRELIKNASVRKNALLLSAAAQWNHPIASKVASWFYRLRVVTGLYYEDFQEITLDFAEQAPNYKLRIIELIKAADLGITDFSASNTEEISPEMQLAKLPASLREQSQKTTATNKVLYDDVLTVHPRYDENRRPDGTVLLSMDDDESAGTNKFFSFAGPILETLDKGFTLIMDELDAQLHPNLVLKIVSLFQSPITNPNNAQLLFTTHNTHLLEDGKFRRDQIWFAKKDRYGAATLYSLAEFKGVAKVEKNLEHQYLQGRYGGVPYLGDFKYITTEQIPTAHED